GKLAVLNQPFEFVIIGGSAAGAYMIANPKSILGQTLPAVKSVFQGTTYTKESYLELLSVLFTLFKLSQSKGMLALESHVEAPDESEIFTTYKVFFEKKHALHFLCDYLRLLTMGSEDPHQIEDLMDEEIETHHKESHAVQGALANLGDGFPALGIVAAVLGVIKTMGAVNQPPEILGKYIAGALVGTFLGILLSYGFVSPLATGLQHIQDDESKYFECIKVSMIAFMKGAPPAIAVEYGRKTIFSKTRPSFVELEESMQALPKLF
ncbi:flagellar motor stator protein MotA, partial [Alphaproteobacteria bacterium]|nr:flagellar motor stator protein MotA [Alphaproteobacteria bacterium]